MGMGTGQHGAIAKFLERAFDQKIARQQLDWTALNMDVGSERPVQVVGIRRAFQMW
jgi:hypothetical protein